ncbi:MAG TPA: hypothetical protein VIO94_15920 [Phenylobacterium sp.]
MPTLRNTKHELFAVNLAKGKSADEAYQLAGYAENRGNAARLKANEAVQARVSELQANVAKRTEITVAALTEKLIAIAEKSEASDEAAMLQVARASIMDAAKLNGLVVDKAKVESVNRTALISDRPISEEEWTAEVARLN